MDLRSWLSALGGAPAGGAAYGMAAPPMQSPQPMGLAVPPMARGTKLSAEMDYDGSHPRQQEQAARDHFRSYGPQTLADAFIPGYGAGGDAKAASEAFGEGRYGAAAGNALMAAMDFVPGLAAIPPVARLASGAALTEGAFRGLRKKPNLSAAENRRLSNYTGVTEATIPINRMYSTQPRVNEDFMTTESSSGELPFAIKKDGEIYLSDGHHRVMRAAESGAQNVRVRLIDFDAPTETPLLDYKPVSRWTSEDDDLLRELLDDGMNTGAQ